MTNTHTPQEIQAAAAKAAADKNPKALLSLWTEAQALDAFADSKAVETRMTAWRTQGEILAAAVIIGKPGTDLHTVAQQDIADAAKAVGITVLRDAAKKRLRANLYVTAELLAKAQDSIGKPSGPRNAEALEIVRWCQAHDSKGRAQLSKAVAAMPKAQAVKAVSTAALDAAAVAAKAAADADRKKALTQGQTIIAANDDSVYGPLTAQRWTALSAEGLDEIIRIAQAVKAAKAAAKKAADAAKKKAPKVKAADAAPAAAPAPGTDAFAQAVADAVAKALAAA